MANKASGSLRNVFPKLRDWYRRKRNARNLKETYAIFADMDKYGLTVRQLEEVVRGAAPDMPEEFVACYIREAQRARAIGPSFEFVAMLYSAPFRRWAAARQ